MYLYKSFCYENIQDVANSVHSEVFLGNGDAITSVSIAGDTLQITASNPDRSYVITHTPPQCEQPGFNNSFFGIDHAQAAQLGLACALAVVSVWAVKIGKRGV